MSERQAHTSSMTHEQWWSKLTPESQTWLIENNGDVVPDTIAREVEAAGGPSASAEAPDVPQTFEDDVTDWIEATANRE